MNRDRLQGIWRQFSGTLRECWGELTNDPLEAEAGRRDRSFGRIQERNGMYREEAALQLKEFLRRNRDWDLSNR
jgi:uncharacterized protein YjbJ (UPF0337 family)